MADIEEDFLSRDHKAKTAFKTPPFIPRRVLKDLGTEKIMGDRYFSHEFMQQEWEKVWKKTWHFVMKVSELDQPGAFYTHELGKESSSLCVAAMIRFAVFTTFAGTVAIGSVRWRRACLTLSPAPTTVGNGTMTGR